MRRVELTIAVVGAGPALAGAVEAAIQRIARPTDAGTFEVEPDLPEAANADPVLAGATERARAFFRSRRATLTIRIAHVATVDDLAERSTWATGAAGTKAVALLLLQAGPDDTVEAVEARLERARSVLADGGLRVPPTQAACVAYFEQTPDEPLVMATRGFTPRILPAEAWVLECDVLCLTTDLLQLLLMHPFALRDTRPPVALGVELARFLDERAEAGWDLYYFTGSVVQSLIRTLEGAAAEPALRGPSEHSLACGALAQSLLHGRNFVIVVTSAMLDEFRGTLANLREANAKGFIVGAENEERQWLAFQGTLSAREDMREVIRSRELACIHLGSPDELGTDLAEAFARYEDTTGPTVLLASPSVLERIEPLEEPVPRSAMEAPVSSVADVESASLDAVMDLLNRRTVRVLWQIDPLPEALRDRVLSIADRGGIALADSLVHPGSVPAYLGGEPVGSYLGPLGIYGFGKAVHELLCTNGKIRPREEQVVFGIGSALGQVMSPFAPSKLRHIQVVADPTLRAPFTEIALVMDPHVFVDYVDQHLDVDPEVRAKRRTWIEEARRAVRADVLGDLPSLPMSPNYFYRRLDEVIRTLVEDEGYSYTGFYDVGRCGASALRNVARTGRGFSGWYGRALMGDALMASVAIAQRDTGNLVVFTGDGARALVPDVLSPLAEAATDGGLRARNLTIVTMLNGALSLIQSYQEGMLAQGGDRQVRIANVAEPDRDLTVGEYDIQRRRVTTFDADAWRAWLRAPHRVNLLSVVVRHTNVGDGMSMVSERGWQSDTRLT